MMPSNSTETAAHEACDALAAKACIPCKGGVPPLRGKSLLPLIGQLGHGWHVVHEHHLLKRFHFHDFATALKFVNEVGAIAEREGHHPDLHLAWGKVEVTIWSHKIDGLTESDFVLAAKIEKVPGPTRLG
jgi:4a-hydroxytetrahydrobiopterin dehydratase